MRNFLFDLDGTLINSRPGILVAFRYTFNALNLACPAEKELNTFIGPPLEVTFSHYCSTEQQVNQAVQHFRDYYDTTGMHQAHVYSGVKETLTKLKQNGKHLFVTTSKNEPVAEQMLADFGLTDHLTAIYGAIQERSHKADVITACLKDHKLDKETTYIVGDTKYDMIGGQATGIKTIGVTWGFGTEAELDDYGAHHLITQPAQLLDF